MALFEPHRTHESEEIVGSDAATRALSVSVVDNNLVAGVYENIAWFYDITFGPALHPGRVDAIERMAIKPGDRVLEVGVGTGINASLYPSDCSVTGIDLSSPMLEKARERVARKGVRNVRLLQMDAANLKFADDTFDIVYAPYVISVVPDPVAVTREMHRVCRPGGRIVTYGATCGPVPNLEVRRIFWKQIDVRGSTMGTAEDFSRMVQMYGKGLRPVVDSVLPLAEAAAAHARVESGEHFGKIVLRV